jgi:branched-chain amino acid transport system permease protein
MDLFLQFLINGLAIGAVYAIVAVGYSLIYGVLQCIAFSHADTCMVSGYVAYAAMALLGLPLPVAVLMAISAGALLGVIVERVAYRPLRHAPRIMPLISALGVSIILQNAAALLFGPQSRNIDIGVSSLRGIAISGAVLPAAEAVILITALILGIGLYFFLKSTRIGLAIRAVACDAEAAEVLGIPSQAIVSITFAVSSAVAAVGGLLVASAYDLFPTMGVLLGFKAFTACVLGGIRSLYGSIVAAVCLGVVENLAAGYLSSEYKDAYAFAILVGVLAVRPQGLFGASDRRI